MNCFLLIILTVDLILEVENNDIYLKKEKEKGSRIKPKKLVSASSINYSADVDIVNILIEKTDSIKVIEIITVMFYR